MNPQLIKLLLLVSHKSYREKLEYYDPVGNHIVNNSDPKL